MELIVRGQHISQVYELHIGIEQGYVIYNEPDDNKNDVTKVMVFKPTEIESIYMYGDTGELSKKNSASAATETENRSR